MNDEQFDLALRRAIRAEAYRPQLVLDAHALRARLAADTAARRRRTAFWALVPAAAVVVAGAVAISLLGQRPVPSSFGGVEPTWACEISPVAHHDIWWKEVGGPNAFFWLFGVEPDPFYARPYPWPITARFDPDALAHEQVEIWADRLGDSDHVPGSLSTDPYSPDSTRNVTPSPPAQLPGGWYLFDQRFPVPGCWRLSAAIEGRVVGSAIVNVRVGTAARLPVGTYVTSVAIGPCFAFTNSSPTYAEPTAVRAWWWEMGGSGDCGTRESDVISPQASILPREDSGYDLVIELPLLGGGTREVRIALYVLDAAPEGVETLIDVYGSLTQLGGVVLSAGNESVFFIPVETVDPTLFPGH